MRIEDTSTVPNICLENSSVGVVRKSHVYGRGLGLFLFWF